MKKAEGEKVPMKTEIHSTTTTGTARVVEQAAQGRLKSEEKTNAPRTAVRDGTPKTARETGTMKDPRKDTAKDTENTRRQEIEKTKSQGTGTPKLLKTKRRQEVRKLRRTRGHRRQESRARKAEREQ